MNLYQVETNCTYIISHISGYHKCRLLELGFTRCQKVVLIHKASFNGPIEVEIRYSKIALSKQEAESIFVYKDEK